MAVPNRPTLAGWYGAAARRRARTTLPDPGAPRPVAGDHVGPYRLIRLLGSGGMADVFEAEHPLFERTVALKIARSDDDRSASFGRLELEAEILQRLRHPAVGRIYDTGALPCGTPWFAMERIDGETLTARLTRGPIDPAFACRLLAHLASALRAALAIGVVHRDLKPDNVILEPGAEPRCKLIDWGIARMPACTRRHTEIGLTAGTPGYMAPEQARGHEVDWRSDVYALGVTAFEMLTGRPPFEADSSIDLIVKHLCDAPPPASRYRPEVPDRLDDLLLAMIAKQPGDRPRLPDLEVQLRAIARSLEEPEPEIAIEYDVELGDDEPGDDELGDPAELGFDVSDAGSTLEAATDDDDDEDGEAADDDEVVPLVVVKRPGPAHLVAAALA